MLMNVQWERGFPGLECGEGDENRKRMNEWDPA